MKEQEQINYDRIAKAIDYIKNNFKKQPSLDEIAENINLSPFLFQRLLTEWTGTSPQKFLRYISVEYAKRMLKVDHQVTLFNTSNDTGLSNTSRLHDLFISIEGMRPAEFQQGGRTLSIYFQFADSPFGKLIIASTRKGICYMAFNDDENVALANLKAKFPNAEFQNKSDRIHQNALAIFQNDWNQLPLIKLHLKGTDFQLKVWEALLKIPMGQLTTYSSIAHQIEKPNASRVIGTAIGRNPVAFLIPCHRVIRSTGTFGGYMWGNTRKTAIIGWEGAKTATEAKPDEFKF